MNTEDAALLATGLMAVANAERTGACEGMAVVVELEAIFCDGSEIPLIV